MEIHTRRSWLPQNATSCLIYSFEPVTLLRSADTVGCHVFPATRRFAISVVRCLSNCGPEARKESKLHPHMSVLKLHLLVDLHQKVGALVLTITSCPTIFILENTLNLCIEKNMGVVTYTTGIMLLVFTFGCGEFFRRWSAITESLRNKVWSVACWVSRSSVWLPETHFNIILRQVPSSCAARW